MKIAIFLSHPIQHFSPLWVALNSFEDVKIKVYYYAKSGSEASYDPDFKATFKWNIDLLSGYEHEFLPRQWPTNDEFDHSWKALNSGLKQAVNDGCDVAYVAGYASINNWLVAYHCRRAGIPLLFQGDTNFLISKIGRSRTRLFIRHLLVTLFFKQVSMFLAVGDQNRKYLSQYGITEERIRYCAIPVDTQRFQHVAKSMTANEKQLLRTQYNLKEYQFIIGFCGKFRDIKRPNDICQALQKINRPEMVGLFIGSGQMEQQVREMGGEQVRITGFVNQEELPKLLSICDITVMPSEFDNHPLSVTESQCLGIPVVLSDMCGCYGPNDVFRDKEGGLLYPCGDINQLAEKITYLADHPMVLKQMGQRAVELADTQSVTQTAIKFYRAAKDAIHIPN